MSYVDVVTVKPTTGGAMVMRTAPAWSSLKEGAEVMFEIGDHPYECKGTVVDVATFDPDGEEYRLLKGFARDLGMRITKRIVYDTFNYKEGENNG